MPILQWLFKAPSNTCSRSRREQCNTEEETIEQVKKSRELVIFDKERKESEDESKRTFTVLLRRYDSRACFYTTLVSFEREQYFRHSKNFGLMKMGHENENVTVGCKVLPICDIASIGFRNAESKEGGVEKDTQKRRRGVSKMKELMRWAAAANKTGRAGIKAWKVLYFRNKITLKNHQIDDASSNSSKISFRWDVGSCSTSSSVFSPLSIASAPSRTDQMWDENVPNSNVTLQSSSSNKLENLKTKECNRGQWITSDSDFVVLEL